MSQNTISPRKIIPLKFPIPIKREGGASATIHQIEIGRLKGKHLQLLPASLFSFSSEKKINPDEMIPFLMVITGLDEISCGELDLEDIIVIVEEMSHFFGFFRQVTGG